MLIYAGSGHALQSQTPVLSWAKVVNWQRSASLHQSQELQDNPGGDFRSIGLQVLSQMGLVHNF